MTLIKKRCKINFSIILAGHSILGWPFSYIYISITNIMVGNVYVLGQRRIKILEKRRGRNVLVRMWGPDGFLKEDVLKQKELKSMHFLCNVL